MARNLRKMSARKSRGQDKQAGKHKVEIIETKQEEMLKKKVANNILRDTGFMT